MRTFLGIDGGGTKTEFVLLDETGRVRAAHRAGSAYYPQIGIEALATLLAEGIATITRQAGMSPPQIDFAYIGLPAHGEDSALTPHLDSLAARTLPVERYRCGNDVVCGWAGALAGADGINLVAGTGSIAYGEWAGRSARAGGWGETFSDEGSAYWVAREALTVFSRMSDGRTPKGPLYDLIRERFGLRSDLDLCAAVYGPPPLARSEIAGLAPLVVRAAAAGDAQATRLFEAAARELKSLVDAVWESLDPPTAAAIPVSYSGGMLHPGGMVLNALRGALLASPRRYEVAAPKLKPAAGAALHAARLNGSPLAAAAVAALARQCAAAPAGAAA